MIKIIFREFSDKKGLITLAIEHALFNLEANIKMWLFQDIVL
jgi:hypothetical protein